MPVVSCTHAKNCPILRYIAQPQGAQRDECLNGEIFWALEETQTVIEKW
jgi:hypothetical protein